MCVASLGKLIQFCRMKLNCLVLLRAGGNLCVWQCYLVCFLGSCGKSRGLHFCSLCEGTLDEERTRFDRVFVFR